MFARMLKHDLKDTWRILWIALALCLSAGIMGCGTLRMMFRVNENSALMVLTVIAMLGSILALIACAAAACFIPLIQFYRSRYSERGYLTFTLPLNEHQILLSGVVNIAVSWLACLVVVFISMGILLFFGIADMDGHRWEIIRELPENLHRLLYPMDFGDLAVWILGMICGIFQQIMLILLSITIGSVLARKHRILAAVGVYYVINFAISLITAIFTLSAVLTEAGYGNLSFCLVMNHSSVLALIVGVTSYFVMHYLVRKKLNLV